MNQRDLYGDTDNAQLNHSDNLKPKHSDNPKPISKLAPDELATKPSPTYPYSVEQHCLNGESVPNPRIDSGIYTTESPKQRSDIDGRM